MTIGLTLEGVLKQEFSDREVYLITNNANKLEFSNGNIYYKDIFSNTYYLVKNRTF